MDALAQLLIHLSALSLVFDPWIDTHAQRRGTTRAAAGRSTNGAVDAVSVSTPSLLFTLLAQMMPNVTPPHTHTLSLSLSDAFLRVFPAPADTTGATADAESVRGGSDSAGARTADLACRPRPVFLAGPKWSFAEQ